MVDCQSTWGPPLLLSYFFLILIPPSYPIMLNLPFWVLNNLFCPRTTWLYPSIPLQAFPAYTLGLLLQHPETPPPHTRLALHVQPRLACCQSNTSPDHIERIVPTMSQCTNLNRSLNVRKQLYSRTKAHEVKSTRQCFLTGIADQEHHYLVAHSVTLS